MMDGYSVTEAASVLGVPTERVWELLARGVLAGVPEGEAGMRVYLQPRPAPVPVAPVDDPVVASSNGPERELSPFRELLTEFRNLTERYGQALLALGEARGEVASLRSRVDLLEARIDLRLPMGPPSVAPWPAQPLAGGPPSSVESPVEHEDEEAHRPRRRGARRATESFAQALARAEDPSPADLPGGPDAGHAEPAEDAERSLPLDVLPAEQVLVADEAEAPEPVVAEAPVEASEPPTEEAVAVGQEPEPVEVTEAGPDAVPSEDARPWTEAIAPEPPAEDADEWAEAIAPESDTDLPEVEAIEFEPLPERAEPEVAAVPEVVAASDEEPPIGESDAGRYSTLIEEPDWLEVEADEPPTMAPSGGAVADPHDAASASDAWTFSEPPAGEVAPEADAAWPANDSPPDVPAEDAASEWSEPPADDGGADEMEVVGGGPGPSAREQAEPEEAGREEGELPGSRELDEAMGAFGDLERRTAPPPRTDEEWPPTRPSVDTSAQAQGSSGFGSGVTRQPYGMAVPGSPATRAYRRLRRIFPT
jgi:hypothetical protein